MITILGLESINATLEALKDLIPALEPQAQKNAKVLEDMLKTYPPALPNSHRTNTLQNSITSEVIAEGGSLHVAVYSRGANRGHGNYEQYVLVEGQQTKWNALRWQSDVSILDSQVNTIVDDHWAVIDNILQND